MERRNRLESCLKHRISSLWNLHKGKGAIVPSLTEHTRWLQHAEIQIIRLFQRRKTARSPRARKKSQRFGRFF